ncbi:MAG: tetratricopeptide repeat protein [Lachnospiraceae bacterium]|nr:tetratricopeptide repeat protein [Lachnospiraceae bacterium]
MSEEIERGDTELLGVDKTTEEVKIEIEQAVIKKKKSKMPFVILGTILLIGIAVFIAIMVASAKPERKVAKELELARQYLDEMDYEMAIASYTKAIEIDSKNVDAYEGLANTYVAMAEKEIIVGNMDLAIEYYENAITALEQGEAETGDEGLAELLVSVQEMKQETEQQNQTAVEKDNVHENIMDTNEAEGEETKGFICMTAEEIMQASEGDVVTYGTYMITKRSYEWNDYGTVVTETGKQSKPETPIEWIVLVKDEGSVTLLSKYVLDTIPYDQKWKPITWEKSEIREWLNNDFYNTAFTEIEKAHVQTTTCVNGDNTFHGAAGGNTTQDKVFLLSIEEIEQYFGVKMEDYSGYDKFGEHDWASYGAFCNERSGGLIVAENPAAGGVWCWWLRTPGVDNYFAASVHDDGGVDVFGDNVHDYGGVRPVIRIGL